MSELPQRYKFLATEPGPKMVLSALSFYGLHEAPGGANNPIIMGWATELGITSYIGDDTPWCGLACAKFAKDAGKAVHFAPLWARNWLQFGVAAPAPMLGDVLVFARPGGGGHVGLYVGEDADAYHVLGGNEGDSVNIVRMSRARLLGARRPDYHILPPNVRVILMGADGPISNNEA